MEFKHIIFPIKTDIPITYKSLSEYMKEIEPGTTLSKKQLEVNLNELDINSCIEDEKNFIRKSNRLNKHYLGFAIRFKGAYCKFCHTRMIGQENPIIEGYVAEPKFCPKCNNAFRNLKCLYCGTNIQHSALDGVFCEECLMFIDEEQFKKAYQDKIKEIRKFDYKPPQKIKQICLEKKCQKEIDKSSNPWFYLEHWHQYQKIKKDFAQIKSFNSQEREIIREQYYEKVNPKWVWKDYLGPALKEAKNGNYVKGQQIVKNLLEKHKNIPDYPLNSALELLGDLCYFNAEYDRAISYYKKGKMLYIDKILNARRLAGETITGDELILVSQNCYHVNEAIDKNQNPLIDYTKQYKETDFFKRNKDLVGQFAEELAQKWENKNNKKLLEMGGEKRWHDVGIGVCEDYIRFTGNEEVTTKNGSTDWYNDLFKEKGFLGYKYADEKVFRKFVELIVDIIYEAENLARQYMGIAKRGKGWVSETELYYKTKKLFSEYEVLQHASPDWLSPQHLDIFIPDLKLAIEYQGLQHVKPIDFFGGEKAFIENQRRDLRKKQLCEKHNINLTYIYESETQIKIQEKLKHLSSNYLEK
ncbi:MAG: hypothetical protein ACD_26C00100G0002 [uncultured bacterium]|nr:MAG: hypothetical protein ACD_26C00100G0002 [uncultured bacterium]